MQALIPVHSH